MSEIDYDGFASEDFASDDHFISWCLHDDGGVNAFWSSWVEDHPEQRETVEEARRMVVLLHRAERTNVQSAMKEDIWRHLNAQISRENQRRKHTSKIFTIKRGISIAASFLLLLIMYQWWDRPSEQVAWTKHLNDSDHIEELTLSDGTEVDLLPNSLLEYSSTFGSEKREIALQGAAFFDVARDTTKPFLVYANQTITRVLGTSFLVKAIKGDRTVEVEVETGAVSVLARVGEEQNRGDEGTSLVFKKGDIEIPKPNYKVNLSPNEKISFDINQRNIVKSIVEIPKLLDELPETLKVDFDNEPVTEVFAALEVAYGIDLEYEAARFDECSISTVLDDSPLFTKLDIICAALDLSYKQENAVIYIEGNGCEI